MFDRLIGIVCLAVGGTFATFGRNDASTGYAVLLTVIGSIEYLRGIGLWGYLSDEVIEMPIISRKAEDRSRPKDGSSL